MREPVVARTDVQPAAIVGTFGALPRRTTSGPLRQQKIKVLILTAIVVWTVEDSLWKLYANRKMKERDTEFNAWDPKEASQTPGPLYRNWVNY